MEPSELRNTLLSLAHDVDDCRSRALELLATRKVRLLRGPYRGRVAVVRSATVDNISVWVDVVITRRDRNGFVGEQSRKDGRRMYGLHEFDLEQSPPQHVNCRCKTQQEGDE